MPYNRGSVRIIVATVAFGMGVDKGNRIRSTMNTSLHCRNYALVSLVADIRHVIHLSVPQSIESYLQEIGTHMHTY